MLFGKKDEEKKEPAKAPEEEPTLTKNERLEHGQIMIRAVLEVLGKPEKHVEDTLNSLIKQMRETKSFEVIKVDISESKEIEGLYSQFAEVEFWGQNINVLSGFCLDYMPSSIEVMEPEQLNIKAHDVMGFLNDFLAKLHNVDMFAKNLNQQNHILSENLKHLTRNIMRLVLAKNPKSAENISKVTGINKDGIDNILDSLKKEGMIRKKGKLWELDPAPVKKEKVDGK